MAIVPTQLTTRNFRPNPIMTIEEYATYILADECSLLGVINAPNQTIYECDTTWIEQDREYMRHYFSEAQQEIEDEIGYFLNADWVVGNIVNERDNLHRYVDQQYPASPNNYRLKRSFRARWKHLLEMGTRTEEDIELGASVNNGTDPAVVIVATVVTDINEIHVFHPSTDNEINPSSITLSGGNATIEIPRCRLVLESLYDQHVDYTVVANFESEVDVKRIYNDPTNQVTLTYKQGCNCDTRDVAGCITISNNRLGTMDLGGSSISCSCGNYPSHIGFNYYSGNQNNTEKAKDMVVRLAHSKMPNEPCGCEVAQRLWERDRTIPDVLTKERLECPYGINDGAWIVWRWTQAMKQPVGIGI